MPEQCKILAYTAAADQNFALFWHVPQSPREAILNHNIEKFCKKYCFQVLNDIISSCHEKRNNTDAMLRICVSQLK